MSEIIPAVLPRDTDDLRAKMAEIPLGIKIFHLDILESDIYIPIHRNFEAHLMLRNPEAAAPYWVERGAERIIVHKLTPEILKLRSKVELGLGVEMHIPIDKIRDQIGQVDFVQLMSIEEIGEQGHPFMDKVFDRIREVRNRFPSIVISVDGGVNVRNYQMLREMGVQRLVVGSGFKELWYQLQNGTVR